MEDRHSVNNIDHLKRNYIKPTNGDKITKYAPYLKHCIFCLSKVNDNLDKCWFVPEDISCCICERCYEKFADMLGWKKSDGGDIDWTLRCPKCKTELKIVSNQDYVYLCEKCRILYDEAFDDEVELENSY